MKSRKPLLVGVLCIGLVAWVLLPSFIQYFAQREVVKIQQSGVKVKVTGLAGKRIGVSAESIEGWATLPIKQGSRANTFPVSYRLDDILAVLNIPTFRPWDPSATFTAKAYDGVISGTAVRLMSIPSVNIQVSKLNMSLHPQLRALGFDSGELSLVVENHPLNTSSSTPSEYQVTVDQMAFTPPPAVRELVKISTIENGKLSARLTIQPTGRFVLSSCSLTSSLAQANLTGRGALIDMKSLDEFVGTMQVTLLGEDGAKLAQWLPLLTNQRLQGTDRNFSCALQIRACESLPGFDFRVGQRCGKATCGA